MKPRVTTSVFRYIFVVSVFHCAFGKEQPACVVDRLYLKADFPVGVAINTHKLRFEEKYWTAAVQHFNGFTPEKILKPQFLQPKQGEFNFFEADRLMEFCSGRKIRLHGHTLIWHLALPQWMEKFKGSAEEWDEMMKTHIQTVIKHCSNTIKSWDLINEAFDEDGSLRKNIWYKNIGENYIEKACRYAKEADTSVLLFYNDYSLEKNSEKLDKVLEYFNELKRKGISVDGIGLQMHVSLNDPAIEEIEAATNKIARAGYLVHFSELDVNIRQGQPLFRSSRKLYEAQRERYQTIVEVFMKLDKNKRFGITLWGVSDNDSWLTQINIRSRPLLFNSRYQPKPALCGFVQGLSVNSQR